MPRALSSNSSCAASDKRGKGIDKTEMTPTARLLTLSQRVGHGGRDCEFPTRTCRHTTQAVRGEVLVKLLLAKKCGTAIIIHIGAFDAIGRTEREGMG
ncbi:hypothetical protein PG988_013645 [Apiospora saccharicola]